MSSELRFDEIDDLIAHLIESERHHGHMHIAENYSVGSLIEDLIAHRRELCVQLAKITGSLAGGRVFTDEERADLARRARGFTRRVGAFDEWTPKSAFSQRRSPSDTGGSNVD